MLAGQGLIEHRHRPRCRLYATLALEAEDGAPVLPGRVLWALGLTEGDLLTVRRGPEPRLYRFRSYLAGLESLLDAVTHPWPYLEPMLRLPMAVVGPRGRLLLPEEAADLAEEGTGALVLHAEWRAEELFELEGKARPPVDQVLWMEKEYTLPIVSGDRVILPEEALWLLGLRGGGRLACRTALIQADFEPAFLAGPSGARSRADVEADGTLLLPASLLRLQAEFPVPYTEARLTIEPPRFRLQLWRSFR